MFRNDYKQRCTGNSEWLEVPLKEELGWSISIRLKLLLLMNFYSRTGQIKIGVVSISFIRNGRCRLPYPSSGVDYLWCSAFCSLHSRQWMTIAATSIQSIRRCHNSLSYCSCPTSRFNLARICPAPCLHWWTVIPLARIIHGFLQ